MIFTFQTVVEEIALILMMLAGHGYFHIHVEFLDSGKEVILHAPCMYIPSISSTLVNFLDIPTCKVAGDCVDLRNDNAYCLVELEDDSGTIIHYKVPLICVNTHVYTADQLMPSAPSSNLVKYYAW
jgi:hypothetical protein